MTWRAFYISMSFKYNMPSRASYSVFRCERTEELSSNPYSANLLTQLSLYEYLWKKCTTQLTESRLPSGGPKLLLRELHTQYTGVYNETSRFVVFSCSNEYRFGLIRGKFQSHSTPSLILKKSIHF
jgi:hypothetical protein